MRFINTIDGSRRLASAQELSRAGYKACLLINANAQKTLPGIDIEAVTFEQVERVTLGQNQVRRSLANCAVNGAFVLFDRPDVVVAQRQYLREMRASNPAFSEYEEVGEVKFTVLAEASSRVVRAQEERRRAEQAWLAEIDALAASGSKDKVGSLTLSALRLPIASGRPASETPNRAQQGVRICTLNYAGQDRPPILGYGYRGSEVFAPTFKANADAAKWTVNLDRPFTRLFPSIDEMYAAYQQDPEVCHVLVDFPRNLRLLMTAIERDTRERRFQVNELISSGELRDGWARKSGFQDFAASEFAAQIGVDSNTVKRLGDAGVTSRVAYDSVVKEMIWSRYSEKATPAEVLTYLDDKAKAAAIPGATAVTVLADRRAREEAEARDRAQKAEAEARARREREEAQRAEAAARAAKEAEAQAAAKKLEEERQAVARKLEAERQAAAKKLEAERMVRAPELCKTDYKQCMTVEMLVKNFRGLSAARKQCEERTRDIARWSFRFVNSPAFTGYYNSESEMKQILNDGTIRLWDDSVEFQNGFGAWRRQEVVCFYDLQKSRAIIVQAQ